MVRKKIDSSLERQFLTALVTNKEYLAAVAGVLELELLVNPTLRLVAGWCLDHFKHYGVPPRANIEAVYHGWVANEQPKEDEAELVLAFLESISEKYANDNGVNVPYLVDETSKYLNMRRIVKLKDDLEWNITTGNLGEAQKAVTSFRSVQLGGDTGYDPTIDRKAMNDAFATPAQPLMSFKGKDGRNFFNPIMTRDSLVGVQGIEKMGKTWWCLEFVYQALLLGHKVALFEVGDLSKNQLSIRMAMRMAQLPLWRRQCAGVQVPTAITLNTVNNQTKPSVTATTRTYAAPLDSITAKASQRKFRRFMSIPDGKSHVMFSTHPSHTLSVRGIDTILKKWQQEEDFVPDVIIIDYADILAAENSKIEYRHQVNETWSALRRLSQEWHALVITPTQAKRTAYKSKIQKMDDAGEDKRKNAHVTAMLGLNQNEEDRKQSVMRLNWILVRESPYTPSQCLWVAQCIPLGMAYVCATL